MEQKTNWLAILVAVLAAFFVGFMWYGVLFQGQWMAGNGITMQGDMAYKDGVQMSGSMAPMFVNIAAMAVYALFINWLITRLGTTSWLEGAKTGGVVGLIMAIGELTANLFAANPMSLTMVDGSYSIVLFAVIGAIVGGWRKK